MKKKLFLLGALFLLGSLLFINKTGFAQNVRSGDNVSIVASETIDSILFTAGSNIDIAGTVNGDVYCAGMNVSISGNIKGDVYCAAQTLRISGKIDGNVKLAGQVITLTTENIRNAGLAGQSITIDSKTKVNQDLILAGQDVTINGSVSRDLFVGGQNVTVANKIGRDIKGEVENLTLTKSAKVGRNVEYTSPRNINLQEGSSVGGEVTKKQVQKKEENKLLKPFGILYIYFAMTIVSLVLLLIFPKLFENTYQRINLNIGKSALIGFVGIFLGPIVFALLMATVVGIPLAILGILVWLVTLTLSGPVVAFYVGKRIWKDSKSTLISMLIGSLILITSYLIPVLGFFAILAVGIIGVGAVLGELFNINQPISKKVTKTKTK